MAKGEFKLWYSPLPGKSNSVTEAKVVIAAIPTGSDAEIAAYLAKQNSDSEEKVKPSDIASEDIKEFKDNQLPEYQALASGQLTQDEYEKKHELKTTQTDEEKTSDENTFKGFFLLMLLSKSNLVSLVAAAGVAFKLCANA